MTDGGTVSGQVYISTEGFYLTSQRGFYPWAWGLGPVCAAGRAVDSTRMGATGAQGGCVPASGSVLGLTAAGRVESAGQLTRRGGGVSGIPGRNAVAAVLGEDALG